MKFYEAIEIVKNERILSEEEKFKSIKNVANLANNLEKASSVIKNDLSKISKVVENKIITRLTWNKLGIKIYSEFFDDFYEFADGCSGLLDRQEIYERAATPKIKEALKNKYHQNGYNVGDEINLKIAEKSLLIYWDLVDDIIKIAKLIGQYNELDFVKRNKWQLNIPEMEFRFRLRRVGEQWKKKLSKNS